MLLFNPLAKLYYRKLLSLNYHIINNSEVNGVDNVFYERIELIFRNYPPVHIAIRHRGISSDRFMCYIKPADIASVQSKILEVI
jgi:hypothetical protein